MMRLLPLVFFLLGSVNAQFTAPSITIGAPATPQFAIAHQVVVQPSRVETLFSPGHSTANLTFTLFSKFDTQVSLKSNDPRLGFRGDSDNTLLRAYTEASIIAVATAPHSGTISVLNTEGEVIATFPYTVAPAKTVNQSLNLSYSPTGDRASLSYSISGVPVSPLDPRWNASVNTSVNTETGQVSGGISIGVSW